MLRLKFGPFVEANWNHPMNTAGFNGACREFGVEVVTDNEDVIFQDIHYCLGEIDRPTIVFDRHDTSRVTPVALSVESNPHVLGYCLPLLAKQPELSIAKHIYNGGVEYPFPVKPVRVVSTMLWNRMFQAWTRSIEIPQKTIRASFCGTVHYPSVPFTQNHRRQMMDHWPVEKTFAMFNGVRHYYFNEQQQFEFIRRSRVVVSPWGVCEVSIRDYEAVMGCAMMVTPWQADMTINCNPWHERNTVYCEPDFSDLHEAISKAEDMYDEGFLRSLSRGMIEEGDDISKFAQQFCESVKCFM